MPELAEAIDARQQVIGVTGPGDPEPLAYFSIEDEVVQFHGFHRADQRTPADRGRWHVSRGTAGTTKAPTSATGAWTPTRSSTPSSRPSPSRGGVTWPPSPAPSTPPSGRSASPTPAAPASARRYSIGDELVGLLGYCDGTYQDQGGGAYGWVPDETCWYVDRGVEGTLAASHAGGAAVTEFDATAGGGGFDEAAHDAHDHAPVLSDGRHGRHDHRGKGRRPPRGPPPSTARPRAEAPEANASIQARVVAGGFATTQVVTRADGEDATAEADGQGEQ